MKKIILFVALVLGVSVFSSCTSTFDITTKTAYREIENLNQIGVTQYTYKKIQAGTEIKKSSHVSLATSTIHKISYKTEYDGGIVANLHLADGYVITVSVANGMMNNPQFLYGKEMTYYKTYWGYDTTYLYEYQKTTNVIKNRQVVSTMVDTVSDFSSDLKFSHNITHTDRIPVTSSYPAYHNTTKCTVIDYKEKDTLHISSYEIPFSKYKTDTDSITFEMPLYDTTVTRVIDDTKSYTDVKCIDKRINSKGYQLKLCYIERKNADDIPHAYSRWVATDKEIYDKIYIPEQYFLIVSDFDKFHDRRIPYFPVSYLSHLNSTEKTQIVIHQQADK